MIRDKFQDNIQQYILDTFWDNNTCIQTTNIDNEKKIKNNDNDNDDMFEHRYSLVLTCQYSFFRIYIKNSSPTKTNKQKQNKTKISGT